MKLPLLARRYAHFCQRASIEVSVSFMNRPNYINILSKRFGFKGKVLVSERAMPSLQYGYGDAVSTINRFLIRTFYPQADAIVANSHGNAADLRENFHIGNVPITVMHNPCDLDYMAKASRETADGFPADQAFTFITVGRMDAGKNHRLLLDALWALPAPKTRLVLIGDGPLRRELEAHAAALGLAERVIFAGRQSNPYAWLARADCFVFGSNHEGFPNVILEALACALPVVSTDCPSGPREILMPEQESPYGILVPVGDTSAMTDAMNLLYHDPALREHYAKRATIRAASFALEPFAEKFMHYIDAVATQE